MSVVAVPAVEFYQSAGYGRSVLPAEHRYAMALGHYERQRFMRLPLMERRSIARGAGY